VAKSFKWLLICAVLASCQEPNSAYRLRTPIDGPPVDASVESRLPDGPLSDRPEDLEPEPAVDAASADAAMSDATIPDAPLSDVATEPLPPPPPDLPPPTDLAADRPPDSPGTTLPTPVAYWRLDTVSNGMTPDDRGQNPGTVTGAVLMPGGPSQLVFANPNAATLDGVDDYIGITQVRNLPGLSQPKAVSLWFWCNQDTSGILRKTIFTIENLAAQQSIHLGLEYGEVAMWRWASASGSIVAPSRAALSQWHHIGYSFDGQTHLLYLDGVQLGMASFNLNNVPAAEVFLGTYHPTDEPGERFRGRIDDVRIYDRALTASQFAALYSGRQ
jgi:hypothetical protein